MTFDQWWATLETMEQRRADKEFTREAFAAGAASRDAEIAQLNKEAQEKFSTLAKERDQPHAELAAAMSEIERKMSAGQFVLEQLAAEQATNMRLREALEYFFPDWRSYTPLNWRYKAVEALSTTSDTSALEAIVNKAGEVMRDRFRIAEAQGWLNKEFIRALPAVTLEDLKGEK